MKRSDHPAFSSAWANIRQQLAHIEHLAHRDGCNRQDFDTAVTNASAALETLKTLIPVPTLAVGQKVRITLDNGYLGQTATVLHLDPHYARVMIHNKAKTETDFHLTDLEPVSPTNNL